MRYIILFHKSQKSNVIIDGMVIPFMHILSEEEHQDFITGKVGLDNYYIFSGDEIISCEDCKEYYPDLIGKTNNDVEAFKSIDGVEVIRF